MKYFLAIVTLAVLVTGCAKKDASTADQAAAAASDAAVAAATSAATAAAAASAADASSTSSTSSTAAPAPDSASGAPFKAIDLPIYPGALKDADKSMSMSANGGSVKIDLYVTKDDADAVIAWYKAHLPSDWQNFSISSGKKSAGTFTSPEHGDDGQSVIATGQDEGGTQIQVSTKLSGK